MVDQRQHQIFQLNGGMEVLPVQRGGWGWLRNSGYVEFVMPVRHLSQDVEWVFGYIRLTSRKEV